MFQWNTAQYNWQETCKKNYTGWPDGQRCFFVPSETLYNRVNAYQACLDKGAVLAAVLTSSEHNTIRGNYSAKYSLHMAMQRNPGNVNEPDSTSVCTYPRNSTYFYANSNITTSPKLLVNNTWFRSRNCPADDAVNPPPSDCLILYDYLRRFGDDYCTSNFRTLCQVSSPVQAFRRVENVCSIETPLATYDVTDGGLEKCMENCRRHGELSGMGLNVDWCRSFNLKGTKCELFTWWSEDRPSMIFTKDCVEDCVHYTYITNIA